MAENTARTITGLDPAGADGVARAHAPRRPHNLRAASSHLLVARLGAAAAGTTAGGASGDTAAGSHGRPWGPERGRGRPPFGSAARRQPPGRAAADLGSAFRRRAARNGRRPAGAAAPAPAAPAPAAEGAAPSPARRGRSRRGSAGRACRPPAAPPAEPLIAPNTVGAQLLMDLSKRVDTVFDTLLGAARSVADLPSLWTGVANLARDPVARARLLDASWKLAVLLGAGLAVEAPRRPPAGRAAPAPGRGGGGGGQLDLAAPRAPAGGTAAARPGADRRLRAGGARAVRRGAPAAHHAARRADHRPHLHRRAPGLRGGADPVLAALAEPPADPLLGRGGGGVAVLAPADHVGRRRRLRAGRGGAALRPALGGLRRHHQPDPARHVAVRGAGRAAAPTGGGGRAARRAARAGRAAGPRPPPAARRAQPARQCVARAGDPLALRRLGGVGAGGRGRLHPAPARHRDGRGRGPRGQGAGRGHLAAARPPPEPDPRAGEALPRPAGPRRDLRAADQGGDLRR